MLLFDVFLQHDHVAKIRAKSQRLQLSEQAYLSLVNPGLRELELVEANKEA